MAINMLIENSWNSAHHAYDETKQFLCDAFGSQDSTMKLFKWGIQSIKAVASETLFSETNPFLSVLKGDLQLYCDVAELGQYLQPLNDGVNNVKKWWKTENTITFVLKVASRVCLVAGLLFAPLGFAYAAGYQFACLAPYAVNIGTHLPMPFYRFVSLSLIGTGSACGLLDRLCIFKKKHDLTNFDEQLAAKTHMKRGLEDKLKLLNQIDLPAIPAPADRAEKDAIREYMNRNPQELQRHIDLLGHEINVIKANTNKYKAARTNDCWKVIKLGLLFAATFSVAGLGSTVLYSGAMWTASFISFDNAMNANRAARWQKKLNTYIAENNEMPIKLGSIHVIPKQREGENHSYTEFMIEPQ